MSDVVFISEDGKWFMYKTTVNVPAPDDVVAFFCVTSVYHHPAPHRYMFAKGEPLKMLSGKIVVELGNVL